MERDGLLQRMRDDIDRRVVNVYLTPKENFSTEIEHLAEKTDDDIWKGFPNQKKVKC